MDTPEDENSDKLISGADSESYRKELPIFVVQRHDSSHLHFDFRLEMNGVLKSWAVPKGPSMNPSDKRLALMVEDHMPEYAFFEGTIPYGQYGAGTVELWDMGTWAPLAGFSGVEADLENGLLEFYLQGKKLKGKFVLLRMDRSPVKNGWLLIKKHDSYECRDPYDATRIKSH